MLLKKIKFFLERHLPRNWIETAQKIYFLPMIISGNFHRRKLSNLCHRKILKIGFLVYSPQTWNSLKSFYLLCKQEKDVEPYLIVCPDPQTNISHIEFFLNEDSHAINIKKEAKLFSVKNLDLDILFQGEPYNSHFPKIYQNRYTSRYTKVCYIPYGYYLSPYKHLNIGYNLDFLANAYALFVDSDTAEKFCIRKIEEQIVRPSVKVFNIGFPRFDLYHSYFPSPSVYTFLWIPRWSIDSLNNDGTNFFKYKENLIEYFIRKPNLKLIIRPHPSMFVYFIQHNIMTEKDVKNFYEQIKSTKNIFFDENLDYLSTFNQSSALIADFSSLIIEFFLCGKPVIYCGNKSEFNVETLEISKSFYDGSSWCSLLNSMETLANDNDFKQEQREMLRVSFLDKMPLSSSRKILDQCKLL